MATGTWTVYGLAVEKMLEGSIVLDANPNLYMMFTNATEVPAQNTDEFESAIAANVVSGTNLPAAGIALTGSTVTHAAGVVKFDVADVSVASVVATGIKNAHIVDKTPGSTATNRLIAYVTFDTELSPNSGTLSITIDAANGVFTIAV